LYLNVEEKARISKKKNKITIIKEEFKKSDDEKKHPKIIDKIIQIFLCLKKNKDVGCLK